MDDEKIIMLYWERDENAIRETKAKYGRYCYKIAHNILQSHEDAEECENDTYLAAWNRMPPEKPSPLSSFLGMLTRRISIDRYRKKTADKRGGGEVALSYEELEECVPSDREIGAELQAEALAQALNRFLMGLPETDADVFIRRYWFFDSIATIAREFGFGESKVKMMLKRTRDKLSDYLNEEGIFL